MTFLAPARLGELVCNVALAGTTSARHLTDDPLNFVLQTSRRLPRRAREAAGRALRSGARREGSVRRAAGFWLVDRPDEARSVLAQVPTPRPGGWRSRLHGEMAVQLGCTSLVPDLVLERFPAIRARALWSQGDLTAAVTAADVHRSTRALHARLASELHVMTPGALAGDPTPPQTTRTSMPPEASEPSSMSGPSALSVLHVLTNSLPHTQSGYAQRSHSVLLAQQSAGLQAAAVTRLGYPVSIGRIDARHTDVVDSITYHRLIAPVAERTAHERVLDAVDRLVPVARAHGADILHATTNYMNAVVARSAAQRLGIPWVYEVRGLLEETWVASRPSVAEQERAATSEKYAVLRARETEMALAADHVFTLSETLRHELVERGIPDAHITVVPNAVDEALLTTSLSPAAARRALGLPEDGFWVGTVSSLVDYEGLDTLVDAIAELRGRGIDARGLIVGDGVSRPGLEAQARALGVASAVTFTGRVPRAAAAVHHQALDVFVVPRRDLRVCRLVTPLKPVEAMACARPVVASDLPALAELVTAPGSGRVVSPEAPGALADVLEELASDEALRASLGASGRAFASTRTWGSVGATYREVMRSVAHRGVAV
ncbi:glycosyltransferase family 4 protein [Sanguibacter antarcticus]|uniref:Glycosyltransferase involved in cell wall biosynthesis n=1 Tax=Sanguibacter antarcticus TaxID=372484 RepID=A0A2A9E0W6_9MICO|nr:glycosyltransferase family 4 protein [Sanguibacter antarcticus]PFG32276.1 glycosyltransferase involved in cell wall biosynthesis [Sanguibacter antarcticus]